QHKNTGSYPPTLNEHKEHILHKSIAPAPLPRPILGQTQIIAQQLAEKLQLVGVLGVEFFLTQSGKLIINEIAPRPHNSGHWTIDACYCSQFEQHIRAISGLNLGSFKNHHNAEMINLIG
ncbi:MAG: 5-(carboxyamino)imidazole ribonucleotide synthase, partial [Phototrophicales bacterium]